MIGDLKHGRTVHSLAKLLALFQVQLNYVSPASLKMPDGLIMELREKGIDQCETTELDDVIASSDVIYVTRIQKERFASANEYETVKNSFCITKETLTQVSQSICTHDIY